MIGRRVDGVEPLSVLERGRIQVTSSPATPLEVARYEATVAQAEETIRQQAGELVVAKNRIQALEDALRSHQVGNLRHLYSHLVNGRVMDSEEAARGLLAPAIRILEEALR